MTAAMIPPNVLDGALDGLALVQASVEGNAINVHGQPERARALGWLVPSWADPSDVPVVTLGRAS